MSDLHGDAALAVILRETLPPRHANAAIAVVTPRGIRTASVGAAVDADYEIGSISKALTGLLYADAVARGELSPTSTLGSILSLGDSPVGDVTLKSLATHRSGIPSVPHVRQPLRRTWNLYRHGRNPYGDTLIQLLVQARKVKVGKPKPAYSNFGFELLGHAVATAAGTTFAQSVAERLAEPLGLAGMYTPLSDDELRDSALAGQSRRGRPRAPWTGEALGPAGGVRATIGDLATLTQALLNHAAPGMPALEPVEKFKGQVRIGAAWVVLDVKGREITWHNGGTGGFSSWIGLDRKAKTGVVVLTATSANVDPHGFRLLAESARA